MILIGVDPGLSGGIAVLGHGCTTEAWKMPDTERDILELLTNAARRDHTAHAYLERVHSMPGQGVASSFKFGQNYGFLRGCLIALGIPFDEVTPMKWQRALGCLTKGDKNVSKAKAQQLFPGIKVTHAIADSLLLAEYGRRLRAGELAAK